MKAKSQYNRLGTLLLFLLTVVCLLGVVLGDQQPFAAMPIQQTFIGEYSRDGDTWRPLDEDAELSALEGDLILRGHFSYDIAEGVRLSYYRDHIGVAFYLNGELLTIDTVSEFAEYGLALTPSVCGSDWSNMKSPGITPADEVEIHLHNPHAHGNGNAYREFLSTLYHSHDTPHILEAYLKPYDLPFQVSGMVLIVAALILLGAALAFGFLRIRANGKLWKFGLLTLFMGGFMLLDTVGFSLLCDQVAIGSYGRQLCMMLAVYCAGLWACDLLTGRRRKLAQAAMLVSALVNCVLIAVSVVGMAVIYDTGIYWAASQVVLCPLLIACAAVELHDRKKKNRGMLLACILLLFAVLLDIAGVGRSIYSHCTCMKAAFALVFVFFAACEVKGIVIDHQGAARAKQLEKELEDSRIATMLSQIQPHFIYNALSSVEQLCTEQPEVASALVHNFSLYLRGNFDELDNTSPITLIQEMEHVQHYVNIEQIRFPDMEFRFDLNSPDFLLPALSVQPLVENAIKHGLMGLERGGTVTVSSYETDKDYCVSVVDDGVGFDTAILLDEHGHIGIRNIRGRIEAMCGGTLTVESTPGQGTRAVITIPKERSEAL